MASGCFDLLAADYDRTWTRSGPGIAQRTAVWRHIRPLFRPGDTVLDLGCGTGEDALYLMRAGVIVRALDASPEMVRIARARGVNAEVETIEGVRHLDGQYAGAISNFGALNCVENLAEVRVSLARVVKSGGYLAICLMGRFCLLESLHYLRRLDFKKAVRRWAGQSFVKKLSIEVFYPGSRNVIRAMAPDFRLLRGIGIGLTVPPSYFSLVSPASMQVRESIDQHIAHWPYLKSAADHQLFTFVRE